MAICVCAFPLANKHKRLTKRSEQPESNAPFHLRAKDSPPLKTEFKPALKLLSRKPAGVTQDGDDENDLAKNKLTAEELRAKTQRKREEKQKKYEEVRARLFGTDDKSGGSSPGNTTPPSGSEFGRNSNGRGRGRGRGGNGRGQAQQQSSAQLFPQYQEAQEIRRPGSGQGERALFDPNYTERRTDNVSLARRNDGSSSGRNTPKAIQDGEIIRGPKGPDASGRGGFSFGNRGGFNG